MICPFCGNVYDGPSTGYCSERCASLDRGFLEESGGSKNERAAIRDHLYLWDHRAADPQNVRAPDHGAAWRAWRKYAEEVKA